jgi:signal transduction histidine kinase
MAHVCGDDQELSAIRELCDEWLWRKYPGLTADQRLAMTRAIFEEAVTDMRRSIPDIVEGVLERYGLVPPSRGAKPIAASVQLAGSK